jgi:hypothetical protein
MACRAEPAAREDVRQDGYGRARESENGEID